MLVSKHVVFGAMFAAVFGSLMNLSYLQIGIIFITSILIDVDHYLLYAVKTNNWSLKSAYNAYTKNKKEKNPKKFTPKSINLFIFHTIEFDLIMLFLAIYMSPWFIFPLIGFAFHCSLDMIGMVIGRYNRSFSIIGYYIRKKNKK